MNDTGLVALAVFAVLLVLIFYIATAKCDKKRITIVSAKGEKIGIDAEIADNSATKLKGLMGRAGIGEYEGMCFVFDKPGIYSFWMFNTTIPLDAIYFDENGSVVDIISMEPCGLNVSGCKRYSPRAMAKYVLEVNRGFSEKHDIRIGNSSLDVQGLK